MPGKGGGKPKKQGKSHKHSSKGGASNHNSSRRKNNPAGSNSPQLRFEDIDMFPPPTSMRQQQPPPPQSATNLDPSLPTPTTTSSTTATTSSTSTTTTTTTTGTTTTTTSTQQQMPQNGQQQQMPQQQQQQQQQGGGRGASPPIHRRILRHKVAPRAASKPLACQSECAQLRAQIEQLHQSQCVQLHQQHIQANNSNSNTNTNNSNIQAQPQQQNQQNQQQNQTGGGEGTEHQAARDAEALAAYTKGNSEFAALNFPAAIAWYSRGLEAIVSQSMADRIRLPMRLCRASAYLATKVCDLAIDDCNDILNSFPRHIKALFCRAFSYIHLQLFAQALNDYDTLLQILPQNTAVHSPHGRLLSAKSTLLNDLKSGKPPRFPDLDWMHDFALLYTGEGEQTSYQSKRCSLVEDVACDECPPLVPIGDSLSAAKERMLEDMKTVLEPTPNTPPEECIQLAQRERALGNQAFQKGEWQDALSHYSMAISYDPEEYVYYTNRALVFLKLGRYAEAITDGTISIERQPSIKGYRHRAAARAELGQHVQAANDYKRALLFDEKNKECRDGLLRSLECIEAECLKKQNADPSGPDSVSLKLLLRSTTETIKYFGGKV
ncbi:hypothetical protein Pelo_15264 [Pelomyxa schiedti]|nr:hypothetical protein Pelo_15264 [Pelomyxa schiedti]